MYSIGVDDLLEVYELLKDRYDLVLTTTSVLDEGFTVDCPIIVGKAHGQIVELYEDGGDFIMDVMDAEQTKGTHWHPNNVKDAVNDIVEFMEGKPIKKKDWIQTKRLTMKPYTLSDMDELIDLFTNPDVTKTFMVPEVQSSEQMEEMVKKLIAFSQVDDTKHLEYGIYLNGKVIGFINDCGIGDEEIEIGYIIHPDYQGRGYASEAVQTILGELREMGFRKVTAGYFEENVASRRVMEKCGMQQIDVTKEEEYRGECHVCHYCEINF